MNALKYKTFLTIASELNRRLNICPLLFGSLGLEKRMGLDLEADDIDILIPELYLNERWQELISVMDRISFRLYDLHEHAFERNGISAAFAGIESLKFFAGIDISEIPVVEEAEIKYCLLGLEDYLKVYTASSKDSYRENKNNGKDFTKIEIIKRRLNKQQI